MQNAAAIAGGGARAFHGLKSVASTAPTKARKPTALQEGKGEPGTVAERIIRFPPRRSAAVWLLKAREGGWLVLVRGHGWIHGDYDDAIADARWLARNLGFPIREVAA
jgi:hypothetical protein